LRRNPAEAAPKGSKVREAGQAVGRVNTNIAPWLSSLSARMSPGARTMCLTNGEAETSASRLAKSVPGRYGRSVEQAPEMLGRYAAPKSRT